MNTIKANEISRLKSLASICNKAAEHLAITSQRLFSSALDLETLKQLVVDPAESEKIDAFVSRFARLQDNLGAKLLPFYLNAIGERRPSLLENLDQAERLEIINSADDWMMLRQLRNQMVYEYIDELPILLDALNAGHSFVAELLNCNKILQLKVNEFLQRVDGLLLANDDKESHP